MLIPRLARDSSRCRRTEEGAIAIVTALSMVLMCVAAAMVLDLGLLRVDQQVNKAAADAATTAGIHGLDQGDGKAHPYAGVCEALEYLKANRPELSGLSGTWTTGNNTPSPYADPCNQGRGETCTPGDKGSWAVFNGSSADPDVRVWIQSGYLVSQGGFAEEKLPVLQTDTGDADQQGCDQLAVVITEKRQPGLGSLAVDGDMSTTIRSVGRVTVGEQGNGAVSLLMLEQHQCQVLNVNNTGASILVHGNGSVPGLIMADSDGTDPATCNKPIIYSNQDHGVVAEAAETVAPDATTALPGVIGVRALEDPTYPISTAYSSAPEVCPEDTTGACLTPVARDAVGRSPIDERYLRPGQGVRAAVSTADAIFDGGVPTSGWRVVAGCSPTAADQNFTGNLFVNCPQFTGTATLQASTVVFNGSIFKPTLQLPNATAVYVKGNGTEGINVGGKTFAMHTNGEMNADDTFCSDDLSSSRAVLVVRSGSVALSNGGLLRLCHTSLILEGGQAGACLPTSNGTSPADYPCGPSLPGNGVLSVTDGTTDWTAPNAKAQMTSEEQQPAWDALEDLALWSESALSGGNNWKLTGGTMHLSGVFMVPNANPFTLRGGGGQQAENCQYISRRLSLGGNGTLEMKPNPYDVVTVPIIGGFTLVR